MQLLRLILRIIWHVLAAVGLVSLCVGVFGIHWAMNTYNLTPGQFAIKVIEKLGSGSALSQKVSSPESSPQVAKSKYSRLPLSKQANTKPFTEAEAGTRRIVRVGPGHKIELPSQAARIAKPGDIIEIDAGEYFGDVAVWRANNLMIRGVSGRPHLNAGGRAAEGKAIWVTRGNNITIENIEFSDAKVRDRNGAGIRSEGMDLTIRNCLFHNNEDGILGGSNRESTIMVEYSEFAYNGYGDGQSHGIYVGSIKRFVFQYNYVHHSKIGHHVKSGAKENFILYNRLMDEEDGNSSYAIDIFNGGLAIIIGNTIHQGKLAENFSLIHYHSKIEKPRDGLYVVNNTVLNSRHNGIFVSNRSPIEAQLMNNLVVGRLKLIDGRFKGTHNIKGDKGYFVNPNRYNLCLNPNSKAINAGIDPGKVHGISLTPVAEYMHPISRRDRPRIGPLDVGAFEFDGSS
ncbi:MAG: right-handed parallel beta-helix repeat-containing protein [Deltaproteobacteria bacterium]|nr:right-handed parallel beta-helix repeat-containing protein [Deltaproteobacteria bacterium]